MNLADYVVPMLAYCETQFPKTCSNCGQRFESMKEYVQGTEVVGVPVVDLDGELAPIETLSFANCACGSTIALECSEHLEESREFLETLRSAVRETGRPADELLAKLREAIRSAAR